MHPKTYPRPYGAMNQPFTWENPRSQNNEMVRHNPQEVFAQHNTKPAQVHSKHI